MHQTNLVINAVKKASNVILSYFGKIDYSPKKGEYYSKQLVTKADIKAEDILFRTLSKKFPNYNFWGEERGFIDKKSKYTWLVDPISSTNNFIHKMPHFAIVVSLLKKDIPILVVVLDSFYNELFHAIKDEGAYLNNRRIEVSDIVELKKAIITPCWSKKNSQTIREGLRYSNILSSLSTTRRIGSLALQLAWIGAGRMDGFIQNENDFFSLVAGSLIVKEAGGIVTDFKGKLYTKNSKSIIASNGKIHDELIKILKKSTIH